MKLATANKYEQGIIEYPTGKFGFVGSGIPAILALDENGHTRVYQTREEALAALEAYEVGYQLGRQDEASDRL